jgi:hypothetical protein
MTNFNNSNVHGNNRAHRYPSRDRQSPERLNPSSISTQPARNNLNDVATAAAPVAIQPRLASDQINPLLTPQEGNHSRLNDIDQRAPQGNIIVSESKLDISVQENLSEGKNWFERISEVMDDNSPGQLVNSVKILDAARKEKVDLVGLRDKDGNTLLHEAVRKNKWGDYVFELSCQTGHRLRDTANNKGLTPMDLAYDKKKEVESQIKSLDAKEFEQRPLRQHFGTILSIHAKLENMGARHSQAYQIKVDRERAKESSCCVIS